MNERITERRIALWPSWDRRDTLIGFAWIAFFLCLAIAGWLSWPKFTTDQEIKDARFLMDSLAVQIHRYAAREGEWPDDLESLSAVPQVQVILDYANPREGFIGFAYVKPAERYDLSEATVVETPILFEVDNAGNVRRDSGLIGYADGSIRYVGIEPEVSQTP